MPFTLDQAIEFIVEDEDLLHGLYDDLDDLKIAQRQAIEETLERWIASELADENGFLEPDALGLEEIDRLEQELLAFYEQDFMNQIFEQMVQRFQTRLETIDRLMEQLELEDAILGADVFEMETVNEEIDRLARSFVQAREGDEDHEGAVDRIQASMQRYRRDRSKSEFTLRQELMDTLQKDANIGPNYTNSIAITSMATIDRKLRRTQTKASGTEYGLYVGPYDAIIRPFCDQWIGQVETWDFWDGLQNNMPEGLFDSPVSVFCGGINCRHRIIAWDLNWSDGERDLRDRFVAGEGGQVIAKGQQERIKMDDRIEDQFGDSISEQFRDEMGIFMPEGDEPAVSIRKGEDDHYNRKEHRVYFGKEDMENPDLPEYLKLSSIYHEYGHAMHFKNRIIDVERVYSDEPEFEMNQAFDQFYSTAKNKILTDDAWDKRGIHQKLRALKKDIQNRHINALDTGNEQLRRQTLIEWEDMGQIADVLNALTNGSYGWGHEFDYWRNIPNADRMEFLAHLFESRYATRPNQFLDYIPNFRQILEEDFEELMQQLIQLKLQQSQ